ncbi:FtsK/SpoIIIE domain-containing protein [Embleya sp. NPDC059259]|uniref:FtsK/SpoIIIE domain-containing protein n=1 Tax=unclassified Embleya TaxID=2699296 RepID=UPI003678ECF7
MVARLVGRTLLYGTVGTGRGIRHTWRWVRADEYAEHRANKPELVEQVRRRRRRAVAWSAGPVAVVGVVDSVPAFAAPRCRLLDRMGTAGDLLAGASGAAHWGPTPYLLGTAVFGTAAAAEWWRRRPKDGGPALLTGRMGSKAVREAFAAAKLGTVRVVGPVVRDGEAWVSMVELPSGVPAGKAIGRGAELASAFGTDPAQVDMTTVVGHGGRLMLRVFDEHPFAGPSPANPIARPGVGATDMWGRVELFRDVRGNPVTVSAFESSFFFGGQPGAGKSMSALALLMAIGMDPHAELWLTPVKQGVDSQAWHPICHRLSTPDDAGSVVDLLTDLVAEMMRRYRVILARKAKKLAPDMGERLLFLWCDELAGLCLDPQHGKDIKELLRKLVAEGRAAGIVPCLLTQKPEDKVVPSYIRDNIKYRWAGRCSTPEMSDTILGRGMAAQGFNAQDFAEEHLGAGWFLSEKSKPQRVRGFFTPDDRADDVARRALELRSAAGTLPVTDLDPRAVFLSQVLAIVGDRARIASAELADRLDQAADAEHVATLLRPLGVTPGSLWIDGGTKRGYERDDLEKALEAL